jgi:hypothetical protein
LHGAKEGGKEGGTEGYRERVRDREGNRERDGEQEKREKYTQFGREASTEHPLWGMVGLTLKLDELL